MRGRAPLETVGKLLAFIAGSDSGINTDQLIDYLNRTGKDKNLSKLTRFSQQTPPSRVLGLLKNYPNQIIQKKCQTSYQDLVALAKSKFSNKPIKLSIKRDVIGHKDHKTVLEQKSLPKDFIRGGRTQ